jgi:TRAP-type mannitol/chloroaromatic compound transport system permease small subunit
MPPGSQRGLLRAAALVDRLSDLVGRVALWLLGAMILIGALNAVGRYLTRYLEVNLSSNAYIELQWYLFSLVFLLGAAYGVRHDAHVRVDVLYGRLGPRGRAWIDLLGTVLFLVPFAVFMILVSYPAVAASWRIREVSPDPGGLPRYPIKALILVAFGLLVLQGLAEIVKQVAILRGAPVRARPAHHRPEEV